MWSGAWAITPLPALLGRVRARVKDKRVLGLVEAFLKAGILTELGERKTPTPARGGVMFSWIITTTVGRPVMRSAGLLTLVTATPGLEHCA